MENEVSGVWKGLWTQIVESARAIRSLRVQTTCAMLTALTVALDFVASFYIFDNTIKISLSYISVAVTGLLLGPVPAMINGALSDVLSWMLKPVGAYFPGYTLSGILGGLIYGLCLYKRMGKKLYLGAFVSKFLVNLLVNVGLNTCWSVVFTGKAYMALLPIRIVKNAAAYPLEAAILVVIVTIFAKNKDKLRLKI